MSSEGKIGELEPRVVTLVAAELVEGARLFERLPPEAARTAVQRHDALLRAAVAEHGGREIDKTRRFLLLFERPLEALRCCLDYHRELAAADAGEGVLRARAAVHLGEVYLWSNDEQAVAGRIKPIELEGQARSEVSRLLALAGAGRTLLTRGAFEMARRSAVGEEALLEDLEWLEHGAYDFAGASPLEVFEVRSVDGAGQIDQPPGLEELRRAAPLSAQPSPWRPRIDAHLPQRPRWRLHRRLAAQTDRSCLEVWLLSHAKTGELRIAEIAVSESALPLLEPRVSALRRLRRKAGARPDLERIVEWDVESPPYFLELEPAAPTLEEWAAERGGLAAVERDVRLRLGARVIAALAAAHQAGIYHGRLGPESVRVGGEEEPLPVLCGFGLESRTSAETSEVDRLALGDLCFRLMVGDLARSPGPFWRRDLEDPLLEEDLASLLDPDPKQRAEDLAAFAQRLRRLEERRAERYRRQQGEKAHRQALELRRARRLSIGILLALSILAGLLWLAWNAGRDSVLKGDRNEGSGAASAWVGGPVPASAESSTRGPRNEFRYVVGRRKFIIESKMAHSRDRWS